MKMKPKAVIPFFLSITTGMTLWLVTSLMSGKREAWDTNEYWTIAFPLCFLVTGILGAVFPEKAWRWGLIIFLSQLPAMMIRNGEIGNLFPLGIIVLCFYSLPAMAIAVDAERLRKKYLKSE